VGEDPVTDLAAEFSAAVEIANGVSGIISKGVFSCTITFYCISQLK
jgi:hypothetical protein